MARKPQPKPEPSGLDEFHPDTTHNPEPAPGTRPPDVLGRAARREARKAARTGTPRKG